MTTCARIAKLFADESGPWGPSAYLIRITKERCGCLQCWDGLEGRRRDGYSVKEVRAVLRKMVMAELGGLEPPSPQGFILEAARLGLIGKASVDEWKRASIADKQHVERAIIALIKKRFTPHQWLLIMLAFVPVGFREERWIVESCRLQPLKVPIGDIDGLCGAELKNGLPCQRFREAGEARCKKHHDVASAPATFIVPGDGAELVEHLNDREALVQGSRAIERSCDEIAEVMQDHGFAVSPRDVRLHLDALYETVRILPHVGLLQRESA